MLRTLNFERVSRRGLPIARAAITTSTRSFRARVALCLVIGWLVGASGAVTNAVHAQVLLPPEPEPPSVFPVGQLELRYAEPHPDQPALDDILPITLDLVQGERGWAAPDGDDVGTPQSIGGQDAQAIDLEPSGLALVLRQVVRALHDKGLYGVDVRPSSEDIDLQTETDIRPGGVDALQLVISVGRVKEIRSIAVGDRIKGDWRINHELHERIRRNSPLRPSELAEDGSTDLLNRRVLEDYLHRLNRHAGRRVEAALAPDEEPGGVVLDYRVLEARPWFAYGQVSNTGTRRTNRWQTRLGVVHRQLTNHDDVLEIEYLNAGGNDVNGIRARYEAPWFSKRRPDWMDRRKGESALTSWLPREKVPWFGMDRLRWQLDFGFGRFEAGRSRTFATSVNNVVVNEQTQFGGRLIYEAFQHRDFFVDLYAGMRLRNIYVDNRTGAGQGEQLFTLPKAGIHAERINQISRFVLDFAAEGSVASTNDDDVERLGRNDADGRYATLDWNLGFSTFLEPLLFPDAWQDPSSESSSTLAHEIAVGFRGQYGFDYRLVPQATQILGGLYSIRGYDQSIAVGDTVLIGTFEYRFHLPRALPVKREPLNLPLIGDFRAAPQQVYGRPDWDLTLRAFVDVGQAIRNRNGAGAGIREPDQTLVGAGLGAELQLRSNFRARIDWATALTDSSDQLSNPSEVGDQEIHVLFSILY